MSSSMIQERKIFSLTSLSICICGYFYLPWQLHTSLVHQQKRQERGSVNSRSTYFDYVLPCRIVEPKRKIKYYQPHHWLSKPSLWPMLRMTPWPWPLIMIDQNFDIRTVLHSWNVFLTLCKISNRFHTLQHLIVRRSIIAWGRELFVSRICNISADVV